MSKSLRQCCICCFFCIRCYWNWIVYVACVPTGLINHTQRKHKITPTVLAHLHTSSALTSVVSCDSNDTGKVFPLSTQYYKYTQNFHRRYAIYIYRLLHEKHFLLMYHHAWHSCETLRMVTTPTVQTHTQKRRLTDLHQRLACFKYDDPPVIPSEQLHNFTALYI